MSVAVGFCFMLFAAAVEELPAVCSQIPASTFTLYSSKTAQVTSLSFLLSHKTSLTFSYFLTRTNAHDLFVFFVKSFYIYIYIFIFFSLQKQILTHFTSSLGLKLWRNLWFIYFSVSYPLFKSAFIFFANQFFCQFAFLAIFIFWQFLSLSFSLLTHVHTLTRTHSLSLSLSLWVRRWDVWWAFVLMSATFVSLLWGD